MTPMSVTLVLIAIQYLVIKFYDKYDFLQKYPKIYEDACGMFLVGVFLVVWQIERMKKC